MLLKLGFYLLEGPSVSFLDFVCYSGYKYVCIVACALVCSRASPQLCCDGSCHVTVVVTTTVTAGPPALAYNMAYWPRTGSVGDVVGEGLHQ